jgi:hypothetical protein
VKDRDPKTKQFLRIPKGEKTPKMLEVEKRLGRKLEDDYREYYIEKKWGQTKMANRWLVPKGVISSGIAAARRLHGRKA